MRVLILAAAVAATCACTTADASGRSDQWIYRTVDSGDQTPVAAFLSWDYSGVLFRAWCEKPGQLAIQYFGADGVPLESGTRYALLVGDKAHPLKAEITTYGAGQVLLGRLALTPTLAAEIGQADQIDIEAPNESGDPWYTGRAEPLKRIVRDCA